MSGPVTGPFGVRQIGFISARRSFILLPEWSRSKLCGPPFLVLNSAGMRRIWGENSTFRSNTKRMQRSLGDRKAGSRCSRRFRQHATPIDSMGSEKLTNGPTRVLCPEN